MGASYPAVAHISKNKTPLKVMKFMLSKCNWEEILCENSRKCRIDDDLDY
jgi:hypothetical protein